MNEEGQPTSPFEQGAIQFHRQDEDDDQIEEIHPFGQADPDEQSNHSRTSQQLITDQPEDFDFFDQIVNQPTETQRDDFRAKPQSNDNRTSSPLDDGDSRSEEWQEPPLPLQQNLVPERFDVEEPASDEALKQQMGDNELSPVERLMDSIQATEPFIKDESAKGENDFTIQAPKSTPVVKSDEKPMFQKASIKTSNEIVEPEIQVQVSVQPSRRTSNFEVGSPGEQASPVSDSNRHFRDHSPKEEGVMAKSHLETQLNMFDMKQEDRSPQEDEKDAQEPSKKEPGSPSALAQDDEELDNEDNDASLDSIDKLQNLLNEINETCIEQLKNEEAEAALECLKRAEQILEDYTNEGKDVDRNMIIIVLYNQACCYQRLSMLDECSNYLDGTIYNLQQKLLSFEDQEQELKDMIESVDRQDSAAGAGQLNNPYGLTQKAEGAVDAYGFSVGAQAKKEDSLEERSDLLSVQDSLASEEVECSRKLSVSQKIFKLRYLCKCHLQLCAVQSQLNKHKDALHHGKMASIYCQELIRNTFLLSESYIGEILKKRDKAASNAAKAEDGGAFDGEDPDKLQKQLGENYYLEDDQKLLDILIKNSHPILKDLTQYLDNFNKYNLMDPMLTKSSVDIAGLNQRFASYFMGLSEHEQELKDLLDKKEQFSIQAEIQSNRQRFRAYEKELKMPKKVVVPSGLGQPARCASGLGDSDIDVESRRSLSRQGSSKANFQRKFVDEETPARIQQRMALNSEEDDFMMGSFKREANLRSSGVAIPSLEITKPSSEPPRMLEDANYFNLRRNVRTLLVTQEEDDWIFNLNIGNVMHLQPLCTEEMNLHVDNSHELSRDAILEKIILLTVSYFCVGTELRFLNNNITQEEIVRHAKDSRDEIEGEKKLKKNQSEMWHAQALEASARFLPSECPLVAHVITNYQKHHSPALTTIPEDGELDDDLKVVRPLNEVKNDNINYYQIIRNHLKPEVKAAPPPPAVKEQPKEELKEEKPKPLGIKQHKEQAKAVGLATTPPPQATNNLGRGSSSEILEPSLCSNPQAQIDSAPPAHQQSQGVDPSALSISCEQFSQITHDHEGIKLRQTTHPKSHVADSKPTKAQQEHSKFSSVQQESSMPEFEDDEEMKEPAEPLFSEPPSGELPLGEVPSADPPSATGLDENAPMSKSKVGSQKSLKQKAKKKLGNAPSASSKPNLPVASGTKPLGNYNSATNLKSQQLKIKVPSQAKLAPQRQTSQRSLKKMKTSKSGLKSSEGTPANEKSKMIPNFSDKTLQQVFHTKLSEKQINPIISSSRIKTMPSNKGSKVIKNLSSTSKTKIPISYKKPHIKTSGLSKKPPLGALGPSSAKNALATEPSHFDSHQAMSGIPPQASMMRTVKQSPGRGLGYQYGGSPQVGTIAFGSKKHSVPVISQTTQLPAGARKLAIKQPAGAETNIIARNIQMLTAALGRKIGFGSDKSTTPKAQSRVPDPVRQSSAGMKTKLIASKKRSNDAPPAQLQPSLAPHQVFDRDRLKKQQARLSEMKDIFSDDDTEANIEGFGDIPSERGANFPMKAFPGNDGQPIGGGHSATGAVRKQVINIPKVSGSSLMMIQKSKIINSQHKTFGQHHLQGASSLSKQSTAGKKLQPQGMKFGGATGQRRVVLDHAKFNNFIQEKMQTGVLAKPRVSTGGGGHGVHGGGHGAHGAHGPHGVHGGV